MFWSVFLGSFVLRYFWHLACEAMCHNKGGHEWAIHCVRCKHCGREESYGSQKLADISPWQEPRVRS